MKHNLILLLSFSTLILAPGCKKALKSSVTLSDEPKAYSHNWNNVSITGRNIRFDIDDGNGSSCILYYDVSENVVSLTQFVGSSHTALWQTAGFQLDNGQAIDVSQYFSLQYDDIYDENDEFHAISFDAGGTGHEDHVLVYYPGLGIAYLLKYVGGGLWHLDWPSSLNYTGGIGGYDLKYTGDKIIAYDFGSGAKNALICYRPFYGTIWVIKNTGSGDAPVWTAAVKGAAGIGGFDLMGSMDKIVAVARTPGNMDLVCYRPSYGYVWYLNHSANSTYFSAGCTTRSGFSNFNFMALQDRLIAYNNTGSTSITSDNSMLCYRPGAGIGSVVVDHESGCPVSAGAPAPGLAYPMSSNPYPNPNTGPNSDVGDHILNFAGNGYGNSSLAFYANGVLNSTQVYEFNPNTNSYTRVY